MNKKIKWYKPVGCERAATLGRWTVTITKYQCGDMLVQFRCGLEGFGKWGKNLRASQRMAERILEALTHEEDGETEKESEK